MPDLTFPEIIGLHGSEWHVLPHNGTNAANNTQTACDITIKPSVIVADMDGAEHAVTARHGRLCEACRIATPAR